MGTITRHAGAPFADGEVLAGADLEGDFNNIYSEFNGQIESSNLADAAVTTAKISASAVTQAKIADGAASASDSESNHLVAGFTVPLTTYGNVGSSIVHVVGSPAREIALFFSMLLNFPSGACTRITYKLLKDGSPFFTVAYGEDRVSNTTGTLYAITVAKMYVDTAPTPGGTHTYQLQMAATGAAGSCGNLNVFVLEPRS